MREILFRGKRQDNGEWITGDLWHNPYSKKEIAIVSPINNQGTMGGNNVIPETVGQYTGMTDKNGVKIFEGDVVIGRKGYTGNPHYPIKEQRFAVKYEHECYRELCDTDYYEFEVIGNIHDNPDLLEAQHENT